MNPVRLVELNASRPHHLVPARQNIAVLDQPFGVTGTTSTRIAGAVLAGLGKQRGLSTAMRPMSVAAAGWLTHQVRTFIIRDTPSWPTGLLAGMFELAGQHDIHVWLTHTEPGWNPRPSLPPRRELLHADEQDLLNQIGPAASPGASNIFPVVPRVDGLVFRSTAQRLLEPSQFAQVDRALVSTVRELVRRFESLTGPAKTRRVVTVIRDLIESAPCEKQALVRVRGAQIAALRTGWHLTVDTSTFLAAVATASSHGALAEAWSLLDGYRDPDFGAVAALSAARLSTETIAALRVTDVAVVPQRSVHVKVPDGVAEIGWNVGGRFVAALHAARASTNPEGRLFGARRADAVPPQRIRGLHRTLAWELGLVVPGSPRAPHRPDTSWFSGHGLTITKLLHITTAEEAA